MHLSQNRDRGKKYMSSMHLEDTFPEVHVHASQVGYTPVVKTSDVLKIRKVEI